MIDDSIRQMNRFVPHSPVPQGNNVGNPMDLALMTGDLADNQQRNELIWTRALLEGGPATNFNSGLTDPAAYSPANLPDPDCQAFVSPGGRAEPGRRRGRPVHRRPGLHRLPSRLASRPGPDLL